MWTPYSTMSIYSLATPSLGVGGLKTPKIIFLPFQAILTNFKFLTINFLVSYFFGGGGWLKSPKKLFYQFSRHFRQFWTTLIFLIVDKKMFYAPHMFCLTEKFAYWVPIKALPNKLWYFLWIVVLQSGNEFTYCFKISIITTGMLELIEFPSLRIHV